MYRDDYDDDDDDDVLMYQIFSTSWLDLKQILMSEKRAYGEETFWKAASWESEKDV
jgi:hypothetical protein